MQHRPLAYPTLERELASRIVRKARLINERTANTNEALNSAGVVPYAPAMLAVFEAIAAGVDDDERCLRLRACCDALDAQISDQAESDGARFTHAPKEPYVYAAFVRGQESTGTPKCLIVVTVFGVTCVRAPRNVRCLFEALRRQAPVSLADKEAFGDRNVEDLRKRVYEVIAKLPGAFALDFDGSDRRDIFVRPVAELRPWKDRHGLASRARWFASVAEICNEAKALATQLGRPFDFDDPRYRRTQRPR